MPQSKPSRKRAAYTPPPTSQAVQPSPQWYKVTMVVLMVVGLAWIVATYIGTPSSTSGGFPIPGIHNWNLAIGFAMMLSGFVMTTRWR